MVLYSLAIRKASLIHQRALHGQPHKETQSNQESQHGEIDEACRPHEGVHLQNRKLHKIISPGYFDEDINGPNTPAKILIAIYSYKRV